MKQFLIPVMLFFLTAGISCQLNAQNNDKKEKTITIKIEKEVDGKKTMVDTTFTMKEGEELKKVLEKYGVKADILHKKHANKFEFDIETDDSLHSESHSMVWVSVDDDKDKKVHKHIIKKGGHDKLIFISEDDDVNVEVIKMEKGDEVVWHGVDENILIEKLEGDSVKIKKKIIIKTDKDGKHKIKSKGGVFTIYEDDDADNEDVIIKEIKTGDSVDVFVKKIKKGKKGKKVMITTDDNYSWTAEEDEDVITSNKVMLKVLDADEQGLKVLNQKEGYKEFKVKDFDVFVNEKDNKVAFHFSTTQKGALAVKIVDSKGTVVLDDTMKKFDGTYKNEIKAQSGTFYIQISQGNKYYIRKLIFEWDK